MRVTPGLARRRRRSGGVAKPRSELEPIVMWLVDKFSNSILGTNLRHPTNKNQQLNPDWQTTQNPEKSVLALHGRKSTKLSCQLARTTASKPHKTACCPTLKIAGFPALAWQQRKRTEFWTGIARKAKTLSYFASLAQTNPNQFALYSWAATAQA